MHADERLNAYSHLLGFVLALAGVWILLAATASRLDALAMTGVVVFGIASVALYAASTACHSTSGEAQERWQRLDHAATFVLIAGSYTPFALAAPRTSANLLVLAFVWAVACVASLRHLRSADPAPPAVGWYAGLGWFSVLAAAPVAARGSTLALACLLGSGLLYSIGTVFYRNPLGWRRAHGVWHVFVIAGTASSGCAMYFLLR
jgi:hemolysin III